MHLTLSEGTPWEIMKEEKLVDELQQMISKVIIIARSKERDVHYAVQLANVGPDETRFAALWSRRRRPTSRIYGMPRRC